MTLKLVDMTFNRQAQKMSSLSTGTQALINNIIAETNTSNIQTPGGTGNKAAFFNHGDDRDPAYQGSKANLAVTINVYYMPANKNEYDNYEVIDKAVGMLSGRRRLVVRTENDLTSFYTTSHPKQKPGLRTNEYGAYTPIDTTK